MKRAARRPGTYAAEALVIGIVALVATMNVADVVAFVPSSVVSPTRSNKLTFGSTPLFSTLEQKTNVPVISSDVSDALPPRDESFSAMGGFEELLSVSEYPDAVQRYGGVGRETGGIWRSQVRGLVPSTVSFSV